MIEGVVIQTSPFYLVFFPSDGRRKRCYLPTMGNARWRPEKNQGVLVKEIGPNAYIICGIGEKPPNVDFRVGSGDDGLAVSKDGTTRISKGTTSLSVMEGILRMKSDALEALFDGVSIKVKDAKDDIAPEITMEVTSAAQKPYKLTIGGTVTQFEETVNEFRRTIGVSGDLGVSDTTYNHTSTSSAKHTSPSWEVEASSSAKLSSPSVTAGPSGSAPAVRFGELATLLSQLITAIQSLVTTNGGSMNPASQAALETIRGQINSIKSQNLKID
jgi:hypothetical protein